MPDIILLTGNLNYPLTLDPSSWLFDDRKFDLDCYFEEPHELDRPPRKYKKRELLKVNCTFAIPLKPFLENSEPAPEAHLLVVETKKGVHHEIPLETAKQAVFTFTKEGKFLNEDGPAHLYFGDGSNRSDPIKEVVRLVVR